MLKNNKFSHKHAAWLLVAIGVIGIFISLSQLNLSPPPAGPAPGSASEAAPSSKKPSKAQIAAYNVAPDVPKYIAIPSISVENARVMPLGLTTANQIASPNNIFDAGWYTGSAKPGQVGAMFIYGHVSSWQANGLFYNLKNLKPGQQVIVTNGANKQFSYKVINSKTYAYDQVDMQKVLAPVNNKPGLNLMTCTGKVIKGTNNFDQRLVVFTSLEK